MPRQRKPSPLYTTGELNKLVDGLCHPLFKTNPGFILVDTVLHGLIEQNPSLSFRKFIRYNLPKLIDQAEKALKTKS